MQREQNEQPRDDSEMTLNDSGGSDEEKQEAVTIAKPAVKDGVEDLRGEERKQTETLSADQVIPDKSGDESEAPHTEETQVAQKESPSSPDTAKELSDKRKPAGELKWHKKQSLQSLPENQKPLPASDQDTSAAALEAEVLLEEKMEEREEAEPGSSRPLWKKGLIYSLTWLPLICLIALIAGLILGYSIIGDQPIGDLFTRNLWEHLYNLIYG
ncbi:hypothetical protein GCM10011571_02660 [Marinithermofilum abyssi]|uniref:DNA-directed RNA polymerase subunit beta n=1 Tax=Marinithermofilum abyssi TaxID=1571185 RepID=A0A8J2VBI4_9BACL|nr:DNA-directed RNA polymerase subunit beta [Marinithermofilum abyssi]GGE05060.1 hypothetical protein GCM10011571_02660 [Marinithermofilum abyssi]